MLECIKQDSFIRKKNSFFFKVKLKRSLKSSFMPQVLKFLKRLPPLSGNLQLVFFPFIHSVSISFSIISFTQVTSILRCLSLTRFEEFKASTRDVLLVLQRTSGILGCLNVSCSMAATNTPSFAASLSARISEANELFVTQSSFFDD